MNSKGVNVAFFKKTMFYHVFQFSYVSHGQSYFQTNHGLRRYLILRSWDLLNFLIKWLMFFKSCLRSDKLGKKLALRLVDSRDPLETRPFYHLF